MGRPRKRQRRRFGTLKTIVKHRREYTYGAYATPLWAFDRWPGLPRVQTMTRATQFEPEVEAWLNTAEREIEAETWTPPQIERNRRRGSSLTFSQYAADYVANRRKASGEPIQQTTREKYEQYLADYLNPVLGDKAMALISPRDIRVWYDSMPVDKAGHGESARRHVYELLSGIFRAAANDPLDNAGTTLIERSPVLITVARPRKRRETIIAEFPQLETLHEAMPDHLALTVYLAGVLGLRQGECLGLERGDIDTGRWILHVRRAAKTVTGKDGRKRTILGTTKTKDSVRDLPVIESLRDPILRHLDRFVGEGDDALLFTGARSHDVVAGQTVRNAWYRALKAVPELAGMDFHDLRHTSLTHLAEAGATGGQLMKVGGHTNLKTVSVYQQTGRSHEEEVLKRLDAMNNGMRNPDDVGGPSPDADGNDPGAKAPDASKPPASTDNVQEAETPEDPLLRDLVAMLARLEPSARARVLTGLEETRTMRILELLPEPFRLETMHALLTAIPL